MEVRLQLPSNYRNEARMYKDRSIYQAAAKVWAEGVPWPEALEICRAAIEKISPKGKGKGKAKGGRAAKGKAAPKAKGKGKAKG